MRKVIILIETQPFETGKLMNAFCSFLSGGSRNRHYFTEKKDCKGLMSWYLYEEIR